MLAKPPPATSGQPGVSFQGQVKPTSIASLACGKSLLGSTLTYLFTTSSKHSLINVLSFQPSGSGENALFTNLFPSYSN